MKITIIERASELAPDEFDALDQRAGAAGCYDRIRQRETDGRWRARYVKCADGGRLLAAIPVYACRGRRWPDPAYDPGTWEIMDLGSHFSPAEYLLVGGCYDRRTGFHVESGCWGPARLRPILTGVADAAAQDGRGLLFPYMYAEAKEALAQVTGGAISWNMLARESEFRDVADPAWEEKLGSRIRYVLRRDRRLISAAAVITGVCSWPDVESGAARLIACHNARKGQADHPEFVTMRYREWNECPAAKLIVFTASSGMIEGYLTALVWDGQLELYEIGLSGDDSSDRLATYLSLMFHQPLAYAGERGLRNIRAGLAAEIPKTARGARLRHLYGGVMTPAQTRTIADGCLR
jgi:hypothetical protein